MAHHDADALARISAAKERAKVATDAQDWQRVKTMLLLAIEAIDTHIAEA